MQKRIYNNSYSSRFWAFTHWNVRFSSLSLTLSHFQKKKLYRQTQKGTFIENASLCSCFKIKEEKKSHNTQKES